MEGNSAAGARRPFRLDAYLVDPKRNRIASQAGEIALQPKVIDVLCALADRQGEVLSRSELIDLVWGKEFGADESLTRAISQLRKAFDDTRGEPRIIETIPKRGYRLIVAPESAGSAEGTPSRRRRAVRWIAMAALVLLLILAGFLLLRPRDPGELPPKRSERTGIIVTVEPFAGDPSLPIGRFADELAAEIARSPLVRVRTRDAPPEAGTQRYRVRGQVMRMGDRLRVDTQLLDDATDEVVWGDHFDRPFDPQFSERASVVGAISSELMLPLLRRAKARINQQPILSLVPWELTLLVTWVPGAEARLPPGPPSENSYWLQRRALEIDRDYAPAHALFAELVAYHALFHPPTDNGRDRERARRHAQLALELAPYDAEVLYQIALYHQFAGDRDRALAMFDRVLDLQPNHPLARLNRDFVAGQCQFDSNDAVARLKEAVASLPASSPRRWVALAHLSALHLSRGEFNEARETAVRSRQIVPMTWTAMTLAAADAELGNRAEAQAVLAEQRREWPDLDLGYFAEKISPRWCLGGPRTSRAQASFRKLAEAVAPARK